MSEKTDGTLAGIVARLESLERVARNRGSLACDHLAGRIANIRGELQQIAQPQPPAEAHCATCACVPGMTPAVRFDTSPAEREGVVRDHLIRMGWTPPSAPVGVDL